jgi:hypothetical protein
MVKIVSSSNPSSHTLMSGDGGKVKLYREMDDNTDYCPHTAFAAALPRVRNAIRR